MKRYLASSLALGLALAATACNRDAPGPPPEEDSPPAPAASEATGAGSIIRPEVVTEVQGEQAPAALEAVVPFSSGGVALEEPALAVLAEILASPQLAEGWPIVLRGHTDSAGNDEANLRASRRRAEAVADWLRDRDVAAERISIVALGEQRPVAPNAHLDGTPDEAGRARNRRVTVTLAPPGAPGDEQEVGAEAQSDPDS